MADLENGLWACDKPRSVYHKNVPATAEFVMAMVKGDTANHWSIKAGDAQQGRLTTMYDGERPPGYHPMRKQGAIILGRPMRHSCVFASAPITELCAAVASPTSQRHKSFAGCLPSSLPVS